MGHPVVDAGFVGACGLALDITGAFFLAKGFVLKWRDDIARETASYWGANVFWLRSASYQAVEARAGLVLLVLGFTGQFLYDSDIFPSGSTSHWWEILLVGGGVGVLIYFLVSKIARAYSQRLVSLRVASELRQQVDKLKTQRDKGEDLGRTCWFYGSALDCNRCPSESDIEYLERLSRFATERAEKVPDPKI